MLKKKKENKGIYKQIVACPCNRILLSNKNLWITDIYTAMNSSWKYNIEWKKPDAKEYMLYAFLE